MSRENKGIVSEYPERMGTDICSFYCVKLEYKLSSLRYHNAKAFDRVDYSILTQARKETGIDTVRTEYETTTDFTTEKQYDKVAYSPYLYAEYV